MYRRILFAALLAATAAAAPSASPERAPPGAISGRMDAGTAVPGVDERLLVPDAVRAFYERRDGRLAWTSREALELASAIREADRHGLDPAEYHLEAIEVLMAAETDPRESAALDLLLTDAFLAHAGDLVAGRIDPSTGEAAAGMPDPAPEARRFTAWHARPADLDPVSSLSDALDGEGPRAALARFAPDDPGYHRLASALVRYREIETSGGWTGISAGPTLRQGDEGVRVEALRNRLSRSADLDLAGGRPGSFTAEVTAAVERFQRRHGLAVDGMVGPETFAALAVPASERRRSIEANLERWRWLPQDLGGTHVEVNVAGFRLRLVQNGETVLESRVVVGKEGTGTPSFSDRIRVVVLNPDWTIPTSIAVEEILPKILEDPFHAERAGIRAVPSDGSAPIEPWVLREEHVAGPDPEFWLVQEPGPENPLGRLKILFPNPLAIYLHDTPQKHLFSQDGRDRSHGCIRVQRIRGLAAALVGRSEREIEELIEAGETKSLAVDPSIPVHLIYRTAWVDEDGAVHFRTDLYRWDADLAAGLAGSRG